MKANLLGTEIYDVINQLVSVKSFATIQKLNLKELGPISLLTRMLSTLKSYTFYPYCVEIRGYWVSHYSS